VRRILALRAGDEIAYSIESGRVVVTRASDQDDPFAVFSEWASDADQKAYRDL